MHRAVSFTKQFTWMLLNMSSLSTTHKACFFFADLEISMNGLCRLFRNPTHLTFHIMCSRQVRMQGQSLKYDIEVKGKVGSPSKNVTFI